MASYSRVLLRMLPLRRWPLPGLGPVWLSEPQSAGRCLWPSGPSFVDRVMGDMERQFQEMEKMSRAFFQAAPLPLMGERESHKEASEENAGPAEVDRRKHYRVSVDVAGFTPEEMTVNLEGRKVTVTAKRQRESQSKESGYWVEHQELRRETLLPPDVDLQAIACSLNPDGQLCIEAPRLASDESPQHTIPIDVKAADPRPGEEDKPKER
ncbi:PREDICTED: heat shock protein 30C-like [Thamnophis sirtalis]|uniref:Heat shock protein 30C-like n=1 Tax=Thamnophis sirtalis TaxID=35019 RepID=A0A6I9XRR5_9SAUR|nr:PREDICTED: heat shock protein 30C-like [Thamnophis sirtalis]